MKIRAVVPSRAAVARVQEQETRKAIATAEQILSKAREAVTQEHDRMPAQLKREVGWLVVQAATTVTGKILPSLRHSRKLRSAVAQTYYNTSYSGGR